MTRGFRKLPDEEQNIFYPVQNCHMKEAKMGGACASCGTNWKCH